MGNFLKTAHYLLLPSHNAWGGRGVEDGWVDGWVDGWAYYLLQYMYFPLKKNLHRK
jgi:hypothetical protein